MQLLFKNPHLGIASPFVSEITSAFFDERESLLILYGYHFTKGAIFRIPAGVEKAKDLLNQLYFEGRLNLFSMNTKIRSYSDPVIIDFYR